jgi:hypothetical protein
VNNHAQTNIYTCYLIIHLLSLSILLIYVHYMRLSCACPLSFFLVGCRGSSFRLPKGVKPGQMMEVKDPTYFPPTSTSSPLSPTASPAVEVAVVEPATTVLPSAVEVAVVVEPATTVQPPATQVVVVGPTITASSLVSEGSVLSAAKPFVPMDVMLTARLPDKSYGTTI